MFFSGQGTTNTEILFLTHIWESECLGMGAYLHCVANSFPCDSLIAHYWKTSLSGQPFLTLISFILFILILIHQFSLLTPCGLFWALGFVLSCPKGQGTLVNFHCFQLCMSKLTCWISHDSLMDLKIAILKTSLLSQQHVMMSKCHMICTNYITHITSIMASWYNLSQNRLKSYRFYTI